MDENCEQFIRQVHQKRNLFAKFIRSANGEDKILSSFIRCSISTRPKLTGKICLMFHDIRHLSNWRVSHHLLPRNHHDIHLADEQRKSTRIIRKHIYYVRSTLYGIREYDFVHMQCALMSVANHKKPSKCNTPKHAHAYTSYVDTNITIIVGRKSL